MRGDKDNKQRMIFAGLGNPGESYQKTRHNAGSMFIDYLVEQFQDMNLREKKLKHSHVYDFSPSLILVKPQVFMNESGRAVREAISWFDVDIEKELTLVHDDLDIPLGKYKLQFAKSPRDHKGVKSVEDSLGTTHFSRLRIGIDSRINNRVRRDGEKYVLERFSEEELVSMYEVFEMIREQVLPAMDTR